MGAARLPVGVRSAHGPGMVGTVAADQRECEPHVRDRSGRQLAVEELPALPRAQPVPEGGDPASGRRARYEEFWALKGVDVRGADRARRSASSGRTARARARCSSASPGSSSPRRAASRCDGRISALLELGAGFHPELSGRENVYLNGAILGLSKKEITARFDDIVEFAGLEEFIDTPVKNYSSGMYVRLGFAVAANVEPEVLLIDEVLSVGDESFQRRCAEKIDEFRRDGRTIVFVSHGLGQVEQLCEDAAWIDKGELREIGPAADVITSYQGESHHATRVEGEQGARWGSGEGQIVARRAARRRRAAADRC